MSADAFFTHLTRAVQARRAKRKAEASGTPDSARVDLPDSYDERGPNAASAAVPLIFEADVRYVAETGTMTPVPRLRYGIPMVRVNGRPTRADRLAYKKQGLAPPKRIPCRDGNRANLKWSNICPRSDMPDKGIATLSTRGRGDRHRVTVCLPDWPNPVYIGTYDSKAEAIEEREKAYRRWAWWVKSHGLPQSQADAIKLVRKGEPIA